MSKSRILVVDDDPVAREIMLELLQSRGHVVEAVPDGFGALQLAKVNGYDLAFLDYHLPEFDGYALARLMRNLGEGSNGNLKVIAMTADRAGLVSREGIDLVFDNLLIKPIAPDALFALVEEHEDTALPLQAFETLFTEPVEDRGRLAERLWRLRGLDQAPRAAVFPRPTSVERERLTACFDLVAPDLADCLLLLRPAGIAGVEAVRLNGRAFLQPLVTLHAGLRALADTTFDVGSNESWLDLRRALQTFERRRHHLRDDFRWRDFDLRLAAYLYVSDRPLTLMREGRHTIVAYAAGFPQAEVLEAVPRLAARGLVEATTEGDNRQRLKLSLTKGALERLLAEPRREQQVGAAA